ncbi:hypothetical protein LPJ61_000902 [Coemansia biformis]|uniref:DUF654-domain-containing protein n=1 Tax=Coemansia biformis TaxID=1286918 RepID=A0A9W7YHG7_9FUNG|nr:hypothetical protein LPJ61_000902 [Coemansia biformis]
MSSRAVRRFLKESGYDDLAEASARIERSAPQSTSNGPESGGEEAAGGAQGNMFDLLMGDDGGDASDGGSDGRQEIEGPPTERWQASTAKKGRGGKGKRGKGKKRAGGPSATVVEDMTMDELEEQLESARKQATAAPAHEASKGSKGKGRDGSGRGEALGVVLSEEQQRNRALLAVDVKYLDSEAEIKRLFGSAVLKGEGAGGGGGGRRRMVQRAALKRLALSHPKPTWPPLHVSPGVEMRPIVLGEVDEATRQLVEGDPTGGQWFVLEHSARFRTIQLEFLSAVMTHDADAIAALAYQHPYHVDALLQMSEIMKQTGGDFGEAGELVERALFAFEQGFAPRFSATNGTGRLDFRRIESRGLFLALFRHMQFMARRGCWRTAFETNKVLLGLDPVHDPYGALLTLDFHALKSRQYEYVRQFVADWTWSPVELLPNWAFSRALAEFMLEGGAKKREGDVAGMSTDLLVEAILVFPTVVPALWTKANISVDPVVLTHPYFLDEQIPDESAMTHMQLLVQMFVERNGALYRTPEVGRWLQEGLLLALEQIALGGAGARDITADAAVVERKLAAQKQLCTYVIPEHISRHVLVVDMEAMKAGLPAEIREATSYAFDPLPPRDDVNVYDELLGGMGMGHARQLTMPGAFDEAGWDDGEADGEGRPGFQALMGRIMHMMGQAWEDVDTSSDSEEDVGTASDRDEGRAGGNEEPAGSDEEPAGGHQ